MPAKKDGPTHDDRVREVDEAARRIAALGSPVTMDAVRARVRGVGPGRMSQFLREAGWVRGPTMGQWVRG